MAAMPQSPSGKSRSHVKSSSQTYLYPEIWLLVFPHLKGHDLRNVSLVCAMFRYMAQPMLFDVLDVSPFLLSFNSELPILRPQTYLTRLLERLEYYQLPHVAHGVHHCWISPYTRSGFPHRNQLDDLDPKLIIAAVVAALPHFPNFSQLSWHCIDIAPEWWEALVPLHLTHLWLNSSSITTLYDTDPPRLSSVQHLELDQWPWEGQPTNHVSLHEDRTEGVGINALRAVVHPEHTTSISVPRIPTACRLFSLLSEQSYNIRTLEIPFFSIRYPAFISAVEHCQNLEALCILQPLDERYTDFHLDPLGPNVLPHLIRYEGPYTHVLQFSRQPLRRISLWGFDEREALCDPDGLVAILQEFAQTSSGESLVSLEVKVLAVTREVLDSFKTFKHLENLALRSHDSPSRHLPMPPMPSLIRSSPPISILYDIASSIHLPPKLTSLSLHTRLSCVKADLDFQERETGLFVESVARRNPLLQRIEVAYGIYWTGMYKAVWGRIRPNPPDGVESISSPLGNNVQSQARRASSQQNSIQDGHTRQATSKNYVFSTVVSSVHPLPLGELTFTEHRRMIMYENGSSTLSASAIGRPAAAAETTPGGGKFWGNAWAGLKRVFRL